MIHFGIAAVLSACNLGQPAPQNPEVNAVNPVSSGIISQGVTGVTSGLPSFTVSFNTGMNHDSVERAIALYPGDYAPTSNPATNTNLGLTSMCNGNWRVRNPNAVPIAFNWDVYNTPQKGLGTVPANSDVFFNTTTGSNTVRVFVGSKLQATKATNPAECSGNPFNFVWSGDSRTVTVTPTAALVSSNQYTAAVSTNAKSDAGVALAQPYASSFTAQVQQTSVTATLNPGGTIVGPEGVSVTAPDGAIDQPANITIQKLTPGEVTSIDDVYAPLAVSGFYRISGNPDIYTKGLTPLLIKIPVREKRADETYRVFRYASSKGLTDVGSEITFAWNGEDSTYDPVSKVVTLETGGFGSNASAYSDAEVYVVISLPPSSNLPAVRVQSIDSGINAALLSSNNLAISCDTAHISVVGSTYRTVDVCPKNLQEQVLQETQVAKDQHIADLGLNQIGISPRVTKVVLQSVYNGNCKTTPSRIGYYEYDKLRFTVCIDDSGNVRPSGGVSLKALIRHEFMHAVQGGFPTFNQMTKWMRESTAEASIASNSSAMSAHSYRPPREISFAITKFDDSIEYKAQDFWVYFGNDLIGKGLSFYPSIFYAGANTDLGIQAASGNRQTFSSAYWNWAKNQSYEKSDRFHPKFIDAVCAVEQTTARDAVLNPTEFNFDSLTFSDTPPLESLTTKVYQFTFKNTKNRTLAAKVTGPAKFKLYMIGDEPNCPGGNDGTPGEWKEFKNRQDSNKLIVIISNTGGGTSKLELEVRAPVPSSPPPTPPNFTPPTGNGPTIDAGSSSDGSIDFTNDGDLDLTYTATSGVNWLNLTSGWNDVVRTKQAGSIKYAANCPGNKRGVHTAPVTITSNAPTKQPSYTLNVQVKCLAPEITAPTGTAFSAQYYQKNVMTTFVVGNIGELTLNIGASADASKPWLRVKTIERQSLGQGVTSTVTLEGDCDGKVEKRASSLTITHNDPARGAVLIPVELDCKGVGTDWGIFLREDQMTTDCWADANWGSPYYYDPYDYWYTMETGRYADKSNGGLLAFYRDTRNSPGAIPVPRGQPGPAPDCVHPDMRLATQQAAGLDTNKGMWAKPADVGAVWDNGDPLVAAWVWVAKPMP